jgi:chromosome segregation protein
MRISKIKLAGFKSFVDPTTLTFSGDLTGIVGPNGCGKSNIIDAILWVLGESSARHLRGDAMADVIFNGSSSRKPVGQAVIELIFDNSAGTLGGQYASYAEIALKRQINREGISLYYLNGTRCRRRDITDLFLGTGLGAGRYSIIAQGTISRVIEARPEELRIFLEEVAGISKYKERRRETENRLQHTQVNLTRLNDIRNELDKQLTHLHKQAKIAERFHRLKERERRFKAELIVIARRSLLEAEEQQRRLIRERETAVEEVLAQVRAIEAGIEQDRAAHVAASERFNEAQRKFYGIGAEISRLEQTLQHAKERRQTLERDRERTAQDLAEAHAHLTNSQLDLGRLLQEIESSEPEHARLVEEEQAVYRRLTESEHALQAWQREWDTFNHKLAETLRNEKGESTRLEHLERSRAEIEQRLSGLQTESHGLDPEAMEGVVQELKERVAEAQAEQQALLADRDKRQSRIQAIRAELLLLDRQLNEHRREQQAMHGRLASLEALQQSALHRDQAPLVEWLKHTDLAERPPLAQALSVAPGWETALETVLGGFLEAIPVDRLETIVAALPSLNYPGQLAVIETTGAGAADLGTGRHSGERLIEKVTGPCPLSGLLHGIYAVETVDEAMALRSHLLPYESVITRDSLWIGAHWFRIHRDTDATAGILHREQAIRALKHEAQVLQATLTESMARFEEIRQTLERLEHGESDAQTGLSQAQEQLASLGSALAAKQAQWEQMQLRKQRIETELQALERQEHAVRLKLSTARACLESIRRELGALDESRRSLTEGRYRLQIGVNSTREEWRVHQDKGHALALRLESLRSQRSSLEQVLARNQRLAEQLTLRNHELDVALAGGEAPTEEGRRELEQLLGQRLDAEAELGRVRAELHALEAALRQREAKRTECEQALQELRDRLEQARLEGQAIQVRLQGHEEQLESLGEFHRGDQLLAELPEEAEKALWEQHLERVGQRIARLGAINLAAIEEHAHLSERKHYLDSQQADLSEALATLEQAIHKIDRETETRFKETFDRVNAGLQTMFRTLFEGGEAYLELTDDGHLLETGVTLLARPPGKRNSTIHLLSGGEKALTALALIFAIFELNRAPFCLLDEVDAPLDDANVSRLCRMLKSMASRVQFLFVTHNKITMEIAERLIGVTMQEPGVSRLVAVDIEEAVAMAATGS